MQGSDLQKLRLSVLNRQRILDCVYNSNKCRSLIEYAGSWKIFGNVEKIALDVLESNTKEIYGQNIAQGLLEQIKKSPLVSTIDHHGILGHSFFLNSNLIFSQRVGLKYLPVFSTAGVSLNNSSWPGCLLITNPQTAEVFRLSFFSNKQKYLSVFSASAVTEQQCIEVLNKVNNLNFLGSSEKNKLASLIEKVFLNTKVLEAGSFSKQACLISMQIWQKVFPSASQLVYLPIEEFVSELLIILICPNTNSVIHKLIFTEEGQMFLEKYFFGLKGGFGKNYGSFLFWGINAEGRRVSFKKNEHCIEGNRLSFELSPRDITKALQEHKIYPTSLLCFLVILEYGFNCLGGFNQINWLTEVKEKFILLLAEMGEQEKAKNIAQIPTENFAEGNLAFLPFKEGFFKASLLDAYLYEGDAYRYFCKLAKKITLDESIDSLLPEMYKIVVPLVEREENLLKISDMDIITTSLMKKKIEK